MDASELGYESVTNHHFYYGDAVVATDAGSRNYAMAVVFITFIYFSGDLNVGHLHVNELIIYQNERYRVR